MLKGGVLFELSSDVIIACKLTSSGISGKKVTKPHPKISADREKGKRATSNKTKTTLRQSNNTLIAEDHPQTMTKQENWLASRKTLLKLKQFHFSHSLPGSKVVSTQTRYSSCKS